MKSQRKRPAGRSHSGGSSINQIRSQRTLNTMIPLYTNTCGKQDTIKLHIKLPERYMGIRVIRPHVQNIQVLLTLVIVLTIGGGLPFLIENNTYKTAYLNTTRLIRIARNRKENNQGTKTCRRYPVVTHPVVPKSNSEQLIYQETTRKKTVAGWEHCRSFTHSLQSYELSAKKRYIILMRNFDYTQEYPGFHVHINFFRPMPIKVFSEKRSKAFEFLARRKIRGFYVHEPTRKRNWLHIHTAEVTGSNPVPPNNS